MRWWRGRATRWKANRDGRGERGERARTWRGLTAAARVSTVRARMRIPRQCALALAVALASCGRGSIARGVTDSTYVKTMADLERLLEAPPAGGSRAAVDSARAAILKKHGVTGQALVDASERLASQPVRAAAL